MIIEKISDTTYKVTRTIDSMQEPDIFAQIARWNGYLTEQGVYDALTSGDVIHTSFSHFRVRQAA